MTAEALLAEAVGRLTEAGISSPRREARLLLAHAMDSMRADALAANPPPQAEEAARFRALVARRLEHEPIAYIVGHKEFWSLDIEVGPGALVPRPETESLVEQLLLCFPDKSRRLDFLDLGTGSGCLTIAALSEYPSAVATAIDVSEEALAWTRRNVAKYGFERRCKLILGDWCELVAGSFDAILANPPYIRAGEVVALPSDVARYEPVRALDGGKDGLCAYRTLAGRIAPLLKDDGVLLMEIGAGQASDVSEILALSRIEIVRIVPDLAGIPRCVVGRPRNR